VDVTAGRNAVIGEMDRPSAKELIFENAVYMHRGRQYLVESLDIENRKCLVREAEVNYFTDGLVKTDIKVLSEDERSESAVLGDILVRSQVAKFKKIRFHTHENIGYGDIDLPEEEMQTRCLALLFGPESPGGVILQDLGEEAAGSVLSGAGTLIKLIAPIFLLCDPRDLGVAERVRDPHFGIPALYIYDKYPGGTGLSEALAHKTQDLFACGIHRAVAGLPLQGRLPLLRGSRRKQAGCTGIFAVALAADAFSAVYPLPLLLERQFFPDTVFRLEETDTASGINRFAKPLFGLPKRRTERYVLLPP